MRISVNIFLELFVMGDLLEAEQNADKQITANQQFALQLFYQQKNIEIQDEQNTIR